MASILKVDTLQKPNGTAPTAADLGIDVAGTILQVVHSTYNSLINVTASSNTSYNTNLSAQITPKSTTSKILVMYNYHFNMSHTSPATLYGGQRILRNGNLIYEDGNAPLVFGSALIEVGLRAANTYLDSPATTSAVTYSIQHRHDQPAGAALAIHRNNSIGSITLYEIAQ